MQQNPTKLFDVEGTVIRETEKAFLFKPEDSTEVHWLPKSQVEWHSRDQIMVIPQWLMEQKEIPVPSLESLDKKIIDPF